MSLNEKLESDLKDAMRQKDVKTLSVLRLIKSAVKNSEIQKGSELEENEILSVLEKQAKQRRDSIDQFEKGGRNDLAENEKVELEIIQKYLPTKLSEDETASLVREVIAELGTTEISGMGSVIKEVMTRSKGAAEGSTVSRIVKEQLS